jgi:hypothetical protein
MPDTNTKDQHQGSTPRINTKVKQRWKNDLADEPDQADETPPDGKTTARCPTGAMMVDLRSDQIRMIR